MIGSILEIVDNNVFVKLGIDINNQVNLVNLHVIFDDGKYKFVGEITDINQEKAKVAIVGEIQNNLFIPGISKKPSFKSSVRIVNMEELRLIFGDGSIKDNSKLVLEYLMFIPIIE